MIEKEGTNSSDRHLKVTPADLERYNQDLDAWVANDFSGACPVRDILDRVGDKWSVLVILRLGRKTERFRQLMRSIDGISQRMLTVTLRGLERDGVVNRKVHDTSPPAVEYSLTPLGHLLLKQVTGLVNWALEHEAEVTACRKSYDQHPR